MEDKSNDTCSIYNKKSSTFYSHENNIEIVNKNIPVKALHKGLSNVNNMNKHIKNNNDIVNNRSHLKNAQI